MKQIVTGLLYSTPGVSSEFGDVELDIGPSLKARVWLVAARGGCKTLTARSFRMVLGAESPEDAVRQHALQMKVDGGGEALPQEWQVHPLKASDPLDITQFFTRDDDGEEWEWEAFHDGFIIVRL